MRAIKYKINKSILLIVHSAITIMNSLSCFVLILGCLNSLECLEQDRFFEKYRMSFFDTDLLYYTAVDRKGNVAISSAGLKSILAMMLEGASGGTAEEISSALRLSPDRDVKQQLNHYFTYLQSEPTKNILKTTNIFFVSNTAEVNINYKRLLQDVYSTEIKEVDFSKPLVAANIINTWVSNATDGVFKNFIEPSQINPLASSVIANTLYFKSSWMYAFDAKETRNACFHVDGACRTVPMMAMEKQLNYTYVESLRTHAIELPYEDSRYSMILLVPKDRDGVNAVIRDLSYMSLPIITKEFEPTEVYLTMPRFKIDFSEDMAEILKKMHIHTLFSPAANLTGIFEDDYTCLNDIYHKVHMSVDEEGTVAATVSGGMIAPLIGGRVQLAVDRPFLFFIRDNFEGTVLFEGKIEEPIANIVQNVTNTPETVKIPQEVVTAAPDDVPQNANNNVKGIKPLNVDTAIPHINKAQKFDDNIPVLNIPRFAKLGRYPPSMSNGRQFFTTYLK